MPALPRGRGRGAGSRRKLAAAATALVCLMLSSAQAAKTKDWPENNKLQRGITPTKVIVRRIHSVLAQCGLRVHAHALRCAPGPGGGRREEGGAEDGGCRV